MKTVAPNPDLIDLIDLETKFSFSEVSFAGAPNGWKSVLTQATSVSDGERYLVRLFRKTGTEIDKDLSDLVQLGIRRVHRVLASQQARDVLVEIEGLVEDRRELGILMLDPGLPIHAGIHRRRNQGLFLRPANRSLFWRNMIRVARALWFCHDAGIVHGSVGSHCIFSHGDGREDFRLGGYEACINIADPELAVPHALMSEGATVSFRQDWIALGRTCSEILGVASEHRPTLLTIEQRLLDRLNEPPVFQLFDGKMVVSEMAEVIEELSKIGSAADGELVVYPSRQVLQSDLPALFSGTVSADEPEEVLKLVEQDFQAAQTRIDIVNGQRVRLITDLAFYELEIIDRQVAQIKSAHKRRANDHSALNAEDLFHRIQLLRDRKTAGERVLRLGPAAKDWSELGDTPDSSVAQTDDPVWFALILQEAFSLLREQYRIYPVEVLPAPDPHSNTLMVLPRVDEDRDRQRTSVGLKPAAEAMARELANDNGQANWVLSRTDILSGDKTRAPDLTFEETTVFQSRRVFVFTCSDVALPDLYHYLRPRRDSGFENAVRRRLRNIVSARSNLALLRLLDDPAQVAFDEALRDIASPGAVPQDLDPSKEDAWRAIAKGQGVNVIVGPPGVGKTYLISKLVDSILGGTPNARILIAAQNHDTLVHMEETLVSDLSGRGRITVRIERSQTEDADRIVRKQSYELLSAVTVPDQTALMSHQGQMIRYALKPIDATQHAVAERVHRDTESLLISAADITLATTSSYVVEELIAEGEQFDWVIVEEAARANGSELVGALLLGNRRVMIGDHNQLSPFDHAQRKEMYESEKAAQLLATARTKLSTLADLPDEVDEALSMLESNSALFADVLAIAARMEEPFKEIAEREASRERATGKPSRFATMLTEQSRMHPVIGQVVSTAFYDNRLNPSERVATRAPAVSSNGMLPDVPLVVLDLPTLSKTDRDDYEVRSGASLRNETEATVVVEALRHLKPITKADGRVPTIAILAPYKGQVDHIKNLVSPLVVDRKLHGFASPRQDGNFVFTSDGFQGSEADVIIASFVRNNGMVGFRAVGFMRSPQRVNVMMSRAKHKLVLITSLDFIEDAVNGVDPDHPLGKLAFLTTIVREFRRQDNSSSEGSGIRIVTLQADGSLHP